MGIKLLGDEFIVLYLYNIYRATADVFKQFVVIFLRLWYYTCRHVIRIKAILITGSNELGIIIYI